MFNAKILKDGLRLGDKCLVLPAQGKRKEIILNRKKIEIICEGTDLKWDYHKLFIPSFSRNSSRWILELIEEGSTSRYKMISEGMSFSHNGVPIERGWPLRNSRLKLGYNFLNFNKDRNISSSFPTINEALISSELPILLQGETGTGKTTMARKIHEQSGRIGKFVHISLKSFNPQLLESELFGHVKGAFTGAIKDKSGAVSEANLGTLFLDEIDSIDLTTQAKLLLFLDNFSFRKVGGEKNEKTDIRLIVASAKPLLPQVKDKTFREDFYYRIASCGAIELRALRDDKEKIRDILDSFLSKNYLSIDHHLRKVYLNYSWPGNIRQLKSHLELKKVTASNGNLIYGKEDKALERSQKFFTTNTDEKIFTLNEMKQKYINWALRAMGGNIAQTALALNISKNTLKKFVGEYQPPMIL